MKVLFFARRMPDLCGAFLHDIDLGNELVRRGHEVTFLTIDIPKEGVNGGVYAGFRYMHHSANASYLESSQVWICPHSPCLPHVSRINNRGYNRPVIATCHFDGAYNMIIANNPGRDVKWQEMLLFFSEKMQANYRTKIMPWPPNVNKTAVIRPIIQESKIAITEPFQGEYITLVNANHNKGVHQFVAIADSMPDHKFLAVRPYYGALADVTVPAPVPKGTNITWVEFSTDVRDILKQTRILLMPSEYESFGRICFEAMYNGIPVIYTKPNPNPVSPIGTTEGIDQWIRPVGISCVRDNTQEWIEAIKSLDNEEFYQAKSEESKEHTRNMNIFSEGKRIADMVEAFTRENPVRIQVTPQQLVDQPQKQMSSTLAPPGAALGFSNGRLRIRR
jgi:glycosyltransferase involved in cell wall biosynthesis